MLDFTGQVAGRQFDRLLNVWVGGAQVFQSSTPEPDPDGITWHVEHDATRYSSLFAQPAPIKVELQNYVTGIYTGVIYGTLKVTYYRASAAYPAPAHADQVIGFPNADSDYFYGPGDVRSTNVTFPQNLTRAYLELYLKGNSCDEFWFGSQPDDFAGPNGLCGGGAFREVQVSIDGQLAGVAWPYPFIFTGGVNPWLWRPMPAVNAFDMPPQVVDLTPYVGLLDDGAPHTISLQVAHDGYYWGIGSDLLLYRDPVLAQTSGALTSRSITPTAGETYGENTGSNGGVFTTSASRHVSVERLRRHVGRPRHDDRRPDVRLREQAGARPDELPREPHARRDDPHGHDDPGAERHHRPRRRRVVSDPHALAVPGPRAGPEGLLPAAGRRRAVARPPDDASPWTACRRSRARSTTPSTRPRC